MDFFDALQIATVRPAAKWLLAAFVLLIFVAGAAIGAYGLRPEPDHGLVMQAGISLAVATIPIIIVGTLLFFTDSSAAAVSHRTDILLQSLVPGRLRYLSHVADHPINYIPKRHARAPQAPLSIKSLASIIVNHDAGSTACTYSILFARADSIYAIVVRVELIVRRANIAILLDEERLRRQLTNAGLTRDLKGILALWPHSIGGAKEGGGYHFGREIGQSEIAREGNSYLALVGSVNLADNLLWNAAEQFYFAEDLMYFLRAVVNERPELFMTNQKATGYHLHR